MKYETIKKFFIGFGLCICLAIYIYSFWSQPSDELKNSMISDYYSEITQKKIDRITVYLDDEFGKTYKIEITDKSVIDKILNAAQYRWETTGPHGRFAQHYVFRLHSKEKIYNFGYGKMSNEKNTLCTKIGINKYGDCGRIKVFKNSGASEEFYPVGDDYKPIISLVNIELIPIIREHIDKVIKSNPEKYKFHFEGIY